MSWKASAWAKDQRLGSPSAKSILMCLADYADPDGRIKGWASQSELAAAAEVSERTAREWLQRLEDWGLVERQRQQRPSGARAADHIVLRLDRSVTDGAERCRREKDGEETTDVEATHREATHLEAPHLEATGLPAEIAGRSNRQPDAEPTGNEAQPTGNQFRAYKDNPPLEPPLPSQQERAEAREREGDEGQGREDDPGSADFQKRVMRLCNGRGFVAGPWKDWDTSSPGWIAGQFAKLAPAERAEAERWRDAYLLDIAARGKGPVSIGVFLRDRLWTGLDTAILDRAQRQRSQQLTPEDRAQPDGWAKCLGPVGMAFLVCKLLEGPADATKAAQPLLTDQALREAWPAVWWWRASQRQKSGAVFGPKFQALKDAMEAVPQGSAVLEAWRRDFDARAWPWQNVFDGLDAVWLPRGGPGGLDAFEAALRGSDHDDGRRDAAE